MFQMWITAGMVILVATMKETQGAGCEFTQYVRPNTSYTIQSPNYPKGKYKPGSQCSWTATTDKADSLVLDCPFYDIPGAGSKCVDYLKVRPTLEDTGKQYCGASSFTYVSPANRIVMSLVSSTGSKGGSFTCTVGSVPKGTFQPDSNEDEGMMDYWDCDCGWSFRGRIVGGVETGVNEFPMMAGLVSGSERQLFCGATIIGTWTVLTAAHCVRGRSSSDLAVLVGDHDLSVGTDTNSASLIRVASVTPHPGYNPQTQVNDIALVRTVSSIPIGARVGPACLPFYNPEDFVGQPLVALGWGTTEFGGATSDVLRKVTVDGRSINECQAAYPNKVLPGTQLCTYRAGKDACQFDSGGPVLWLNPRTNRYTQVGIISYGRGCGNNYPSVNTKVSSYIQWIASNTAYEQYCFK